MSTSWLIAYLYCAGSHLQYKVQFAWVNQEDDTEVIPIFLMHTFRLWFELSIFSLLCFLFLVCWCNWHFYRKQPCLMLGMKCCRFCTWWQCYCCHSLIYYFFLEHPLMVISQKYQKVSNKIIQHMSTYSLYNLLHNLILHPTTKIHLIKIIPIGDTSQLILFLLCVYVILWFHGLCCL